LCYVAFFIEEKAMDSVDRKDLIEEYKLLQAQYESFDQRALMIKSWSIPLLAGGLGVAIEKHSVAVTAVVLAAALCLWYIEIVWKGFQYCYPRRIRDIENYFSQDDSNLAPFQIYSSWISEWRSNRNNRQFWITIARQPFVFVPYIPIAILCIFTILIL